MGGREVSLLTRVLALFAVLTSECNARVYGKCDDGACDLRALRYGFTIFNVANPEATLDPTTREQRFTSFRREFDQKARNRKEREGATLRTRQGWQEMQLAQAGHSLEVVG